MLGFIILAAGAGPDVQEIAPRGDKGEARGCRRLYRAREETQWQLWQGLWEGSRGRGAGC